MDSQGVDSYLDKSSLIGFAVDIEIVDFPIVGRGITAKDFIPKGSLIWKYEPEITVREYTEEQYMAFLKALPNDEERLYYIIHVYTLKGKYIRMFGAGSIWNHSEDPNSGPLAEVNDYDAFAYTDIQPGEQITCDYGLFDWPKALLELYRKWKIPVNYVRGLQNKMDALTRRDLCEEKDFYTGFLVEIEVKEFPMVGRGIAAKHFIPKGTLIWKYEPGISVQEFTEQEFMDFLDSLASDEERAYHVVHMYSLDGKLLRPLGAGSIWNHSSNPNSGAIPEINNCDTFAIKDIHPGEEIVIDYNEFEWSLAVFKLCKKYNVPVDFVDGMQAKMDAALNGL